MDIHLLNALGITNCALFKYTDSHELECLTPELPWLSQVVTLDANNNLEKQHIPSIFLALDVYIVLFLRLHGHVQCTFKLYPKSISPPLSVFIHSFSMHNKIRSINHSIPSVQMIEKMRK